MSTHNATTDALADPLDIVSPAGRLSEYYDADRAEFATRRAARTESNCFAEIEARNADHQAITDSFDQPFDLEGYDRRGYSDADFNATMRAMQAEIFATTTAGRLSWRTMGV